MIMRSQIKDLFIDTQLTMENGMWLSGHRYEGEYREWYKNGLLFEICFYTQGKKNGARKQYHGSNGQIASHCSFKFNKLDGEYKSWDDGGNLDTHQLYKDDKLVKDYMK